MQNDRSQAQMTTSRAVPFLQMNMCIHRQEICGCQGPGWEVTTNKEGISSGGVQECSGLHSVRQLHNPVKTLKATELYTLKRVSLVVCELDLSM